MSRADQAANYILERMKTELDPSLYYHNVPHVLDVVGAAEMIGKSENISDADMELLRVAALFHDAGFMIQADNHEMLSCDIAKDFLPVAGYNDHEIAAICDIILATRVPQNPKSLLEKIICDADLDYLGRDDFFITGNNIFMEFRHRNLVKDLREWNELQVKFLTSHNYFTQTSIRLRNAKKEEHLQKIKQVLLETI